ncbi:MAG: DNA methyltransferase [Gemmatimonadales bacterium]
MTQRFQKLKTLLMELFQLDQPDLDFGFYRVMHAKSAEVSQFLDQDLLPQVREAFEQYEPADKAVLEKQLAEAIGQAKALGVEADTSPKVQELRQRIASEGVDIGGLEAGVYDHLYGFFRRYYSDGDFLSKRVYKEGTYAIPYEGEEVKLYWANADQYYIKTSEYLRDYAFRLRPGDENHPKRVHFRLVDVQEGQHGNVKEQTGKERRFKLAEEDAVSVENGELVVRFTYQPDEQKQKDLNETAEQAILALRGAKFTEWVEALGAPNAQSDEAEGDAKSKLRVHLDRYTARNTFDYFIHKDLGGFLRRELDFYIKNEVMHLDDVESESAPRVEQYLSKIKVIRRIAAKIITFLAQLEDFQKTLWLKKKFVVETSYCIRLGVIPEAFYPEIARNEAQREEWVSMCGIGELTGRGTDFLESAAARFTKPLTPTFLKTQPTLMVDTSHFTEGFTAKLCEAMGPMGIREDCVLIHGDNFSALGLMQRALSGRVPCIYIDPPYNTDASAIAYKNGYKSSSWMALLQDRLHIARRLLTPQGVLIVAIDDEQQRELGFILDYVFDGHNLGTMCVRSNPSGRPTQTGYSVSHEYMLFRGNGPGAGIGRMPPTDEQMSRFNQRDEDGPFEWRNLRREGSNSDRTARPKLYYPMYVRGSEIRIPAMEWDEAGRAWTVTGHPARGEIVVWPTNDEGAEKTWRWEWETVLANRGHVAVRPDRTGRAYIYVKRRPHEDGVVSVSSWFDAKYSATEHGTAVLKALFKQAPFSYPKSIHLVRDAIYIGGGKGTDAIVLDFFAGSGTTGHAVININRTDGGRRRVVLVEQNSYFDSVLIPRLKKITYSPAWNEGRPERPATAEEAERSPRIMKVIRLESYEDTLNNLELRRTPREQEVLDLAGAKGPGKMKEQYILRYLLDVESRGSQSLLNIAAFTDPTAYKLKAKRPGSDESTDVNVDLLETFNWLIGLTVDGLAAPRTVTAKFKRDAESRLRLDGKLTEGPAGKWWFRGVTGSLPDGRSALVVWRKRPGGDDPEGMEQDNLVLDEWVKQQDLTASGKSLDVIWVNGTNNLQNLKDGAASREVRLIDEDFHRLMFETDTI